MNIVINKDISKIKETMFFGLPMRETLLSGATIAIGFFSYRLLYEYILNDDLLILLTAVCCLPTGFITLYNYQGMHGEKLIVEFFRSLFIKDMILTGENRFCSQVRDIVKSREKEGLKNDKAAKKLKNQEKRKKAKLQKSQKSTGHHSVQQDL